VCFVHIGAQPGHFSVSGFWPEAISDLFLFAGGELSPVYEQQQKLEASAFVWSFAAAFTAAGGLAPWHKPQQLLL